MTLTLLLFAAHRDLPEFYAWLGAAVFILIPNLCLVLAVHEKKSTEDVR